MSRSQVNVFSLKALEESSASANERKPTSVTACQILDLPQRWWDRDMLIQLYLVKQSFEEI